MGVLRVVVDAGMGLCITAARRSSALGGQNLPQLSLQGAQRAPKQSPTFDRVAEIASLRSQ
jgi:hypothetical protein